MHFNSLFKYISNKEAWFYAQFDEFAARGNLFPLRFFYFPRGNSRVRGAPGNTRHRYLRRNHFFDIFHVTTLSSSQSAAGGGSNSGRSGARVRNSRCRFELGGIQLLGEETRSTNDRQFRRDSQRMLAGSPPACHLFSLSVYRLNFCCLSLDALRINQFHVTYAPATGCRT